MIKNWIYIYMPESWQIVLVVKILEKNNIKIKGYFAKYKKMYYCHYLMILLFIIIIIIILYIFFIIIYISIDSNNINTQHYILFNIIKKKKRKNIPSSLFNRSIISVFIVQQFQQTIH